MTKEKEWTDWGVPECKWKDASVENPIVLSERKGICGLYYITEVSSGYAVSMDINEDFYGFGGSAFICNGKTLDEAKFKSEQFDLYNRKLSH